jgi:hypothetical protein
VREILHVCDSNGDGFSEYIIFSPMADYRENTMLLEYKDRWYLCVLCGSQNKQQLFTYTALAG